MLETTNVKLVEYEVMDKDREMVETQILTQLIGKEWHGQVRGLRSGPTSTSYYGQSSRHSAIALIS